MFTTVPWAWKRSDDAMLLSRALVVVRTGTQAKREGKFVFSSLPFGTFGLLCQSLLVPFVQCLYDLGPDCRWVHLYQNEDSHLFIMFELVEIHIFTQQTSAYALGNGCALGVIVCFFEAIRKD